MTVAILGENIQGLIAGALLAKRGEQVTILNFPESDPYAEFHSGYKTGPVTHIPFAMPTYIADELDLKHYGFEEPAPVENPFEALPFYDGLCVLVEMFQSLEDNRPPYREKAWRDTWGTFEIGHVLSRYDRDVQDLFARAATLSLIDLLSATDVDEEKKAKMIAAATIGAKTDPSAPGSAAAIIPAIAPFRQKNSYVMKGSLHNLMHSLKQAAGSFGAEIISDRSIRKIIVTDGAIQSVIMGDETEYAADHYVIDHDPVLFFEECLDGYTPPPAFQNRVKSGSNIKNCVSVKVAVSSSLDLNALIFASDPDYVTTALQDFKGEGGSQYPVLSIENVSRVSSNFAPDGHVVLDITAQYFSHDLDKEDPILKAVKQALVRVNPDLDGAIVNMSMSPVATQTGLPTFTGTMPLLPLLKIFGGYHSIAYDCPMGNVLIAGYGEGCVGHHHVHDGGERIAFLYDSFKENDKKAS